MGRVESGSIAHQDGPVLQGPLKVTSSMCLLRLLAYGTFQSLLVALNSPLWPLLLLGLVFPPSWAIYPSVQAWILPKGMPSAAPAEPRAQGSRCPRPLLNMSKDSWRRSPVGITVREEDS